MSTLCLNESWGREATSSVRSPHPWMQALRALGGQPARTTDVVTYLVQSAQSDLRRVAAFPDDWDNAGSLAPRAASVANAAARLVEICDVAMRTGRWNPPHIGVSESGEVTFEWWRANRKLTIYFGDESMEVLRVWGADMDDEMVHETVSHPAAIAQAWAWLNGN